jgi:uncharacterized protein YndB with AHSA1/START domain
MSTGTTTEAVSVTRRIEAPVDRVFAVLADPTTHAAIDGTGWVCEPLDPAPLTGTGQVFGMGMFHSNHPDGNYQVHNRVEVFDPPRAVAWEPGNVDADGGWSSGGWTWRYDLAEDGPDACGVTLTYDWSTVPSSVREYISFPPFGEDHLTGSLDNLAGLAQR